MGEANFEGAIIGYGRRADMDDVPVLSYELLVDICMSRDGMTHEEAEDFVYANFFYWCGADSPVVMFPLQDD